MEPTANRRPFLPSLPVAHHFEQKVPRRPPAGGDRRRRPSRQPHRRTHLRALPRSSPPAATSHACRRRLLTCARATQAISTWPSAEHTSLIWPSEVGSLGRYASGPSGGSLVLPSRPGWRDLAGRCWHAQPPATSAPPTTVTRMLLQMVKKLSTFQTRVEVVNGGRSGLIGWVASSQIWNPTPKAPTRKVARCHQRARRTPRSACRARPCPDPSQQHASVPLPRVRAVSAAGRCLLYELKAGRQDHQRRSDTDLEPQVHVACRRSAPNTPILQGDLVQDDTHIG
jgi:hypothetical protein